MLFRPSTVHITYRIPMPDASWQGYDGQVYHVRNCYRTHTEYLRVESRWTALMWWLRGRR